MKTSDAAVFLLVLASACAESPAPPSEAAEPFVEAGFVVQEGHASSFVIEDCEDLDTCFGNNAGAPYLLFSLPPHPDHPEALPPSLVGAVPGVPEGMAASAFLDEGEVLVVQGTTPPQAAYLGFTPYLFSRVDSDGARVATFSSLGDTVNQVVMEDQGMAPFNSEVALLVSSDADALAAAAAVLEDEGTPPEALHTLVLPRDQLRMGQDADADAFLLLGRIALSEDPDAEAAYLTDLPLEVLRLTPSSAGAAAAPPPRAERGDGTDELALLPALEALEEALLEGLADASPEAIEITPSDIVALVLDPERCREEVTECLGDNSDTTYAVGPLDVARGDGELLLGPDDAVFLYGVNHTAAGKALYNSVSIYSKRQRAGVLSVDSRWMPGTAEAWLPDHPDGDQLWVAEIRRDCSGRPGCVALSTEFPGVALDESFFFIFRAYLNPGLTVSPGHTEILNERVLVVRGAP